MRSNTNVERALTSKDIAPGLDYSVREESRPEGALQMHVVRVDFKAGWRLNVVPAFSSVLKRDTVSSIARRENSLVAINGGYFAYDGAPVGPLVIEGEWIRLPWKNRTAIGFDADGTSKIDNLKAVACFKVENGPDVIVGNLNGAPPQNGVAVLTKNFSNSYLLKSDEIGLSVDLKSVTERKEKGLVKIPVSGYLVVAKGEARSQFEGVAIGSKAKFEIESSPQVWGKYPTILGAGPRLIRNGRAYSTEVEEEFKPDVTARGPRTAIGIDKEGHWIVVVVTGWQRDFQGMTLPELALEMQKLGAVDAINLDGGASIAMVVKDQVVAKSTNVEMPVANAIVVKREELTQPVAN